jgi:5-methylcytosine-specific restriction endonuclease McrA
VNAVPTGTGTSAIVLVMVDSFLMLRKSAQQLWCLCGARPRARGTRAERHRTAAWDRLSARLRKAHPFCSVPGCPSTDLTLDHIISLAEDPSLALEPLNCQVLCRSHNSARQDRCTDAERQAVHAAIAARTARRARYYAGE